MGIRQLKSFTRNLVLVDQAIEILKHYHSDGVKANEYIFPLLSNDAEYAKFITQADKDRMKPELRHKMYQDVSSKNAVINKYLKKIAALAEIDKPLSMHISRHSFAHIAQESGAESGAIKNILGHSNLATTEKYMGSFDTSKTDETLKSIFTKKQESSAVPTGATKEEQAIELMRGMSPEQIMSIIAAINK